MYIRYTVQYFAHTFPFKCVVLNFTVYCSIEETILHTCIIAIAITTILIDNEVFLRLTHLSSQHNHGRHTTTTTTLSWAGSCAWYCCAVYNILTYRATAAADALSSIKRDADTFLLPLSNCIHTYTNRTVFIQLRENRRYEYEPDWYALIKILFNFPSTYQIDWEFIWDRFLSAKFQCWTKFRFIQQILKYFECKRTAVIVLSNSLYDKFGEKKTNRKFKTSPSALV